MKFLFSLKFLAVLLIIIVLFGLGLFRNKTKPISVNQPAFKVQGKNVTCQKEPCVSKNPKIKNIQFILQNGVRPRFNPQGNSFVFDRKNSDGYYDLYISDLKGNIISSLTEGKPGIAQKNNGNGVFDPTGKYIVFVSEENDHFLEQLKYLGDSGLGLFSNLWATDSTGTQFWKLTNIPIKKTLLDKIPSTGSVNPHFSSDGKKLYWTERYAEGGNNNWGKWRIKTADFIVDQGSVSIANEQVFFTPVKGTYVTYMGELSANEIILSGNLDGQHEYGMDQYLYNPQTKSLVNLTNTSEIWEEDSSTTPKSTIIYMSNLDSQYKFNFDDANWAAAPMERDYYITNPNGDGKQRLTYFNDPSAPEYIGKRVLSVAGDVSPNGQYMAATLGVDFGDQRRNTVLKIALIEFNQPF